VLLTEMGVDDPRAAALKKDELVTFVAEAAAERRFAPQALGWRSPAGQVEEPDVETETDAEAEQPIAA
jgi:ParB family chromosome partitioning protein